MKRFLMAFVLLCSLLRSVPGSANGSTTVYLTVSRYNFAISMKPIFELENKKLYDLFESNKQPNAFVVSIKPSVFNYVHLNNCWGFDAVLTFENYGSVKFRYFPEYKTTMGFTNLGEPIILQPIVVAGHPFKTTICQGEDDPCENAIETTEGFDFIENK